MQSSHFCETNGRRITHRSAPPFLHTFLETNNVNRNKHNIKVKKL